MKSSAFSVFEACGRVLAVGVGAAALAGCATSGVSGIDPLATQSIESVADEGARVFSLTEEQALDAMGSDRVAISTALNAIAPRHMEGAPLTWSNPATGSTGMLSGITLQREPGAPDCLDFDVLRTTTEAGVHTYHGHGCRNEDRVYVLQTLTPLRIQ